MIVRLQQNLREQGQPHPGTDERIENMAIHLSSDQCKQIMWAARAKAEDLLFDAPPFQEDFRKGYLTSLLYIVRDKSFSHDAVSFSIQHMHFDEGRHVIIVNTAQIPWDHLTGIYSQMHLYIRHIVAHEVRHAYQKAVLELPDEVLLTMPAPVRPQQWLERVRRWRREVPDQTEKQVEILNGEELELDAEAFAFYVTTQAGAIYPVSLKPGTEIASRVEEFRAFYADRVSAYGYPDKLRDWEAESTRQNYLNVGKKNMQSVFESIRERDIAACLKVSYPGLNGAVPINFHRQGKDIYAIFPQPSASQTAGADDSDSSD